MGGGGGGQIPGMSQLPGMPQQFGNNIWGQLPPQLQGVMQEAGNRMQQSPVMQQLQHIFSGLSRPPAGPPVIGFPQARAPQ